MNAIAELQLPAPTDSETRIALGRRRVLHGTNACFERTVIRQHVLLGPLAGRRTCEAGPKFAARFARRFARPLAAREQAGPGGFLQRLHSRDGVPMEEAVLAAILACDKTVAELMRRYSDIGYAQVFRRNDGPGVDCAWETRSPGLSRRAAQAGLAGLVDLLPGSLTASAHIDLPAFDDARAELVKRARRRRWSSAMAVIDAAARRLGVPCAPLGHAYLRLGEGVAQQLVCAATPIVRSGLVTQSPRHDRDLQRRLRSAGVPVPLRLNAASIDDARSAAESLGFPIRIKPAQAAGLPGVGIRVRDDAELEKTVPPVLQLGPSMMLEPWLRGERYSLLVVANDVVAAVRLRPPVVTGDGRRNILQLVDELNEDPWRDGITLQPVQIDADASMALALAGHAPEDVLPFGRRLVLVDAASAARGAVSTDVTDALNPELGRLAVRAAHAAGLDVAGVEIVTTDLSATPDAGAAAVTGVSATPDLWMHERPRHGSGRRAGVAILRQLYAAPTQASLPTVLVIGDRRTMQTATACDDLLRAAGLRAGFASRGRVAVNGRDVREGTESRRNPVRFLANDGSVEALIAATTARRAARRGLMIERPGVAVISHVDASRAGRRPELSAAIRAARNLVVATGASVDRCADLARLPPERLLLVATRSTGRARNHVAAGGSAVVAGTRRGSPCICVYDRGRLAQRLECRPGHRRATRGELFAIGVAVGLGLPPEDIARGESSLRVRRAA